MNESKATEYIRVELSISSPCISVAGLLLVHWSVHK